MAFRVPVQKRLFHILTAFITTFAFISYYAMASGDGVCFFPSDRLLRAAR
jgi:bacteriorhodopsin